MSSATQVPQSWATYYCISIGQWMAYLKTRCSDQQSSTGLTENSSFKRLIAQVAVMSIEDIEGTRHMYTQVCRLYIQYRSIQGMIVRYKYIHAGNQWHSIYLQCMYICGVSFLTRRFDWIASWSLWAWPLELFAMLMLNTSTACSKECPFSRKYLSRSVTGQCWPARWGKGKKTKDEQIAKMNSLKCVRDFQRP